MANPTLASMVEELKRKAHVQGSEDIGDTDMESLVLGALGRHNSGYILGSSSTTTLPASESWPVLLLAWSDLMLLRANRFATQANMSGTGNQVGTDRNTPFFKCLEMHKTLLGQYGTACLSLGLTTYANASKVSNITITDPMTGAEIPRLISASVEPPLITGPAAISGDYLILEWSFRPQLNFYNLSLFFDNSIENIKQPWNSDSTSGYPFIRDGLSPLWVTLEANRSQAKIEDLDYSSGQQLHFLLVTRSRSGNYSYSNEHVIHT
jgi:hypothetical protein